MENWKAMDKWLFETFQHDPRIEDGVYIGQRLTPVPLTNYVKYLKERAANETAPWVIFMSDVFDLYPELREVNFWGKVFQGSGGYNLLAFLSIYNL